MEKEDAVNVLQFWLAADNFQSQLAAKKGQYDGQEAQNDAMILYDKWGSSTVTFLKLWFCPYTSVLHSERGAFNLQTVLCSCALLCWNVV